MNETKPPIDVETLMQDLHARLTRRENVVRAVPASARSPETAGRFYELRRNEAYNHHQYGAFGREITVKRTGKKGKVEFFAKRVVRKLLGWYVRPQVEFNASVTRAIAEATKHLEAMATEITELRRENAALRAQVAEATASEAEGIDYHAFEGRFRGSREAIKAAQRQYVACFESQPRVLDVGCGRGEFLELLREAGIPGHGVDLDAGMVDAALASGLSAEQGDAFAFLEGLPDGALGGIYSAQVIEHMRPRDLNRLLQLAHAKLQPGGVFVAETPNAICEPAMRNFYLDPTHIRPVHPELARFLAEEAGFTLSHFVFTSAMPGQLPESLHVTEHLATTDVSAYRDYAIVLRKG